MRRIVITVPPEIDVAHALTSVPGPSNPFVRPPSTAATRVVLIAKTQRAARSPRGDAGVPGLGNG